MKKSILLGLLLLLSGGGTAVAQKLSVISGQWLEADKPKLNLYKVEDGSCHELASSNLTPDGRFGFAFYPEKEGYYVIGENEKSKVNRYIFYFKPGDNLQFEIKDDSWRLTGENTLENKEMEKWHNLVQPLEGKAVYFMRKRSTYADYFPQLEQMLPQVEAYPKARTPNEEFNESFEYFRKYNFLGINLSFLKTPRTAHPKPADFINYYRRIDMTELSSSLRLLDYPDATWLIEAAWTTAVSSDTGLSQEQAAEKYRNMREALMGEDSPVKNPVIKGEVVLDYAGWVKDYASMEIFRDRYAKYLVTDGQKNRFNAIVAKLDDNSRGHAAVDFKFPDVNGKEVALSDFKGKVVYIDIWATWCGPCKGEIPYMGKLEEEFKDCPDMVFLSVSIDKGRDKQKWLDMIGEKQMKGVQLFAGDRSDEIAVPYKVKGIPRFILVGRDGKLVSGDAPRPSSAEIRPLLKKALAR